MENKIIILGYHPFAEDMIKNMQNNKTQVTVIDFDEKYVNKAKKDGLKSILIDSMEDDELTRIGIKDRYNFLFCLHPDEAINVFFIISVRNLNKKLDIVTIGEDNSKNKLLLAGANKVIEPYDMTANKMYDILHNPLINEVLEDIIFGETDIDLEELIIPKNSFLDGVYIFDIDLKKEYNLITLGILDKEIQESLIFSIEGINHKIDFDDRLVVLGKERDIQKLKYDLNPKNKTIDNLR
jgi:voltage-gated potassium channel